MLLYTSPYQSWGWSPPFRAPRTVLIAYFLSNIFLIAFPFKLLHRRRVVSPTFTYHIGLVFSCYALLCGNLRSFDLVTPCCRLLRSVYWSCLLVLFCGLGASEERFYIGQDGNRSGRWRAAAYIRTASSRSYRPSISGPSLTQNYIREKWTWTSLEPVTTLFFSPESCCQPSPS